MMTMKEIIKWLAGIIPKSKKPPKKNDEQNPNKQ
jgi:hypothetical protein